MSAIHVCAPRATLQRSIMECPTCDCRRRFVVRLYEWYAPLVTCCGCGDAWNGEELSPRPAVRGWRTGAIAKAKRDYSVIK